MKVQYIIYFSRYWETESKHLNLTVSFGKYNPLLEFDIRWIKFSASILRFRINFEDIIF
jgi:hypothetical protein